MGNVQYNPDDLMVMVDIETTGLDYDNDLMLEIGLAIVRVDDLQVVTTWDTLLCPHADWQKDPTSNWVNFVKMSSGSYVLDMHKKSGLFDDLLGGDFSTYSEAEQDAIKFLRSWFPNAENVGPMVGSNVANFDRRFIQRDMPLLNNLFHYRNIDFSTVKELCRRYNKSVYSKMEPKLERHRVIADLYDTVNEAKFYVDNFLWAAP